MVVKKLDEATGDVGTPAATYPDIATLKAVCPESPESNIRENAPFILNAMAAQGLTSKNQLIAMIASIYTEVRPFKSIREYNRGKGRHGDYYGRGFLQLTWKDNYRAAEKKFGRPLVAQPDLALDPELAGKITSWYWLGGTGNPSIKAYAENQDWQNVRSIVNAGSPGMWGKCWGKDVFLATIDRGKRLFRSGIQGNFPLSGDYGLGCVDAGTGGTLDLTGVGNPGSNGDALAMALGVFNALNAYSHRMKAHFSASAYPDALQLQAQSRFEAINFGEDLDGEYFVDQVIFWGPHSQSTSGRFRPKGLEVEVIAYRPNPNAPKPNIFRSDSNAPLIDPGTQKESIITATDIPGRIAQAGNSNKGKTTKDSPPACKAGKLACAYAVNKYCIIPAGLAPLGSGSTVGSLAVAGILGALEGGRGFKVPLDQVLPGDIWADARGNKHIGIFTTERGTRVLSNSSSAASFSWETSLQSISNYYGGGIGDNFYRVTS